MKIDEIKYVLEEDLKYYDCIQINGTWGIGKSYEINKIKSEIKFKKNISLVSLFGKHSIDKLRKEIYFGTSGRGIYKLLFAVIFIYAMLKNLPIKISDITSFDTLKNPLDYIFSWRFLYITLKSLAFAISIWVGFHITRDNFGNIFCKFKENNKFLNIILKHNKNNKILKIITKLKKDRIIIFDDFERKSNNIKIEDILGIIEELKNLGYKIIIVTSEDNIDEKEKFIKFKEKVINKKYNITEANECIVKKILLKDIFMKNENEARIVEFIKRNNICNLRTIASCNSFIREILNKVNLKSEKDITDIILASIAIYSEYNDNLYFEKSIKEYNDFTKNSKEEDKKSEYKIFFESNTQEAKTRTENIVERISHYYIIDKEILEIINLIYLDENKKDNINKLKNLFQNAQEFDSMYILKNRWFELDDDDLIKNMEITIRGLQNNEYMISDYPEILNLFIIIKNMGFDKKYLNFCKKIMKVNIKKNKDKKVKFDEFSVDSDGNLKKSNEYKKIMNDLKVRLENSKKVAFEEEINSFIIEKEFWSIEFINYCRINSFVAEKQFMKSINIENLINVIKNSKTIDVRNFGREINTIYRYQNINEYYKDDKNNLNLLKEELEKIDKHDFNHSKKYAINFLMEILENVISRLK